MQEMTLAVFTAFWLGILTSISPCPLTANIAAVSFIGRKVGSIPAMLRTGLLYTFGRTLAYTLLGSLLVQGVLSIPSLSHALQKYMTLLMGPLLVLVAMVLLGLLSLPDFPGGAAARVQKRMAGANGPGAFLLGVVFALSFCPVSAALFFGSLLPLAVEVRSGFILPVIYGVATSLPVLVFAFLLAFGANRVATVFDKIAVFEKWAQRLTGVIFLAVGIWMMLFITIGL